MEAAGLGHVGVTPYGLRHTARMVLQELGVPPHACDDVLGHTHGGTGGQVYGAHEMSQPLTAGKIAIDRWLAGGA